MVPAPEGLGIRSSEEQEPLVSDLAKVRPGVLQYLQRREAVRPPAMGQLVPACPGPVLAVVAVLARLT